MSSLKPAAVVLLTRGADASPQAYLARRSPTLRFFGGYWVFPGGNLAWADNHRENAPLEPALKRCAVRELLEEVNVLSATLGREFTRERKQALRTRAREDPAQWLEFLRAFDLERTLRPVMRLVTPPFAPQRYDTLFLHARAWPGEEPAVDDHELVEGRWMAPQHAVSAWERGEMDIAPPVLHLLRLMANTSLAGFFARARAEERQREQSRRAVPSREKLAPCWFAPGIFTAPLATPTLPPATTTNTVIAGADILYVIDPATPHPGEQQRLFDHMDDLIARGGTFAAILLTHHHADHVGAVNAVSRRYRLPVRAHPETYPRLAPGYLAGEPLRDGERLPLGVAPDGTDNWQLTVAHTPGHAVDHLCFIDSRYHTAIAGDMLSTISTILIDPPEGCLRDYLDSLRRLLKMPIRTLVPAHGMAGRDGHALIRRYLAHRAKREQAVLAALGEAPRALEALLPQVYADAPEAVYPLAARSLLAHLIKLEEEGRARRQGGAWMKT